METGGGERRSVADQVSELVKEKEEGGCVSSLFGSSSVGFDLVEYVLGYCRL